MRYLIIQCSIQAKLNKDGTVKKIIYFVVFLLIIVATAPIVDGYLLKNHIQNYLASASRYNNTQVTLTDYKLGWLSSHANIKIKSVEPANQVHKGPIPEVSLDVAIMHGPVVYNDNKKSFTIALGATKMRMNLPKELVPLLAPANQTQPLLTMHSIISFNGASNNVFAVPPITLNPALGINANWQGLQGNSEIHWLNSLEQTIQTHATLGALVVQSNENMPFSFNLQPITIDSNGKVDALKLWLGETMIDAPGMVMTKVNEGTAAFEQLRFSGKTKINAQKLFDMGFSLRTKKLTAPMTTPFDILSTQIAISLEGLNPQALSAFQDLNQKVAALSNQSIEERQHFILDMLKKVLTTSTALTGDIDFNTSLGELHITSLTHQLDLSTPNKPIDAILREAPATVKITVAAPLMLNLVETYIQKSPHAPATPTATINAPASAPTGTVDMFNEKVAEMMKQGRIPLSQAMDIMTLQEKHLEPKAFNAELTAMKLDAVTTQTLTTEYVKSYALQGGTAAQSPAPAATALPPSLPGNISAQAQTLIDEWLHQGMLVKEQDNFIINVTREKGVMKINGVQV